MILPWTCLKVVNSKDQTFCCCLGNNSTAHSSQSTELCYLQASFGGWCKYQCQGQSSRCIYLICNQMQAMSWWASTCSFETGSSVISTVKPLISHSLNCHFVCKAPIWQVAWRPDTVICCRAWLVFTVLYIRITSTGWTFCCSMRQMSQWLIIRCAQSSLHHLCTKPDFS